ncbi:MAG: FmdB family transcriptional regulator [Deltaproteobacteria bacterium CG_4_10_14_3_um_filter_60_8]|nr:MAG: hypothetical protein AUK28_09580 [Desulfobacterales bacterium CG2_30_60_27]PIP44680.1 MAG: FmdB family transcriptional regulator [Deltaproteobacteria bacterium CG23_combo_of_CG06-09_8_20_14_all_60_8]PIY21169.1 MAG: FmdB family transcriptional regulator [Deltaproteobacteria bacterium CG_4_10_14_3_um_filter_60_8]
MPIYDFVCRQCGEKFEILVMGRDTPSCPRCQGMDLRKQMSAFAARTGRQGGDQANGASGSACAGCVGRQCSTCR